MTMLQFVGGPWDGTTRDLEPIETGSATLEAFYTEDPGAGFYKVDPNAETTPSAVPLAVVWHPSVLRG